MIQITPQMRVVVAVEPADFRKGIDGLARLCKEVLHHDPFRGWVFVFRNRKATALKILDLMGKRAKQRALAEGSAEGVARKKQRTGLFTSGVVSTREGRRIALFFSGRKHAGENLKDVLVQRAADLPPPIQMCDALTRNLPAELETIVANCLAHGRRQFVEVAEHFPEECGKVLQSLAVKAILHRKNALFYKTAKGAHVGDVFMSLIYTCELCGANPFDYLTELERHAGELASNPGRWMPWNYRQTLDALTPFPGIAR